jgi:hypothetical protein
MATSKKTKTNKLGVKNLLVNNINAIREKGTSRTKAKTTISKKSYADMKKNGMIKTNTLRIDYLNREKQTW